MAQSKQSQMVLGFNHNIKHQGRIFHVQTEDSGVDNPHIITHLFVGGNILATKKTSYADIVNADNLHGIVRELMEEQHKAMLRNLVNGIYDNVESRAVVAEGTGPAPPPAPPRVAPQAAPPPPASGKFPPATANVPRPGSRTQPTIPRHEAPTQPAMPAVTPRPAAPAPPAASPGAEAANIRGTRIYQPPPPEQVPAPLRPDRDAADRRSGVTVRPAGRQPDQAAPADGGDKLPPEVVAARRMADRPKPKDTSGPTIFGEDLITEKSLDEVILGYLSGEGEESG